MLEGAMSSSQNVAGVLLAGGRSRRMGVDKADVSLGPWTMSHHMQRCLTKAGLNPILVSHPDCAKDHFPDRGPLAGVHSGAKALVKLADHMIVVPVDMPDLSVELIRRLKDSQSAAQLSRFQDYILPFRMRIDPWIISTLEDRLRDSSDVSVKSFQADLGVESLNVSELEKSQFRNINTPDELEDYKRRHARE